MADRAKIAIQLLEQATRNGDVSSFIDVFRLISWDTIPFAGFHAIIDRLIKIAADYNQGPITNTIIDKLDDADPNQGK